MAFFSAVSSSIGRKLLLYGLRHIDILDKDPADFVSVDVGKRTTLEVRDVGLHVKVSWHGMAGLMEKPYLQIR
jgi:autophagy-related protein 2